MRPFFKAYYHKSSGQSFSGASQFSNPVQIADGERKLLWPEHAYPDLLLSIGTGNEVPQSHRAGNPEDDGTIGMAKDSNQIWDEFMACVPQKVRPDYKYLRMNVNFSRKVPSFSDIDNQMGFLLNEADTFCKSNHKLIEYFANRLISTLFYFRLDGSVYVDEKSCHLCRGLFSHEFEYNIASDIANRKNTMSSRYRLPPDSAGTIVLPDRKCLAGTAE